jgi:uncharacterized membrane protein YgdD (TMEM256/DUF423 family)
VERWFGVLGAIFGALGVGLGAFGAHGLKGRVEDSSIAIWQTAASYQMWHALALIAVAWVISQGTSTAARVSGIAFTLGVLIFSGSLYILVLSGQKWLGAITPLGGLALIVGWVSLALALWPQR